MVKAGDLLAEIDPRSYQVALQQAEGTLATNQALLKNAQLDVQRYRGLFAEDSIAKQTLDTAESLVNQYKGTIKTNQAAVADAKLSLTSVASVPRLPGVSASNSWTWAIWLPQMIRQHWW